MDKKTQQELIEILEEVCGELGWEIAVPSEGPDQPARGLIIGEQEFLADILKVFGVDYDGFNVEGGEINESSEVSDLMKKKKQTLH